MTEPVVLTETDARGVATVCFNRPRRANAYNEAVIDELRAAVDALEADGSVRAVVLRGVGKHFSAGADLAWLRELAGRTEAENMDFSFRSTDCMRALNELGKPTVAAVQGACYGGGMGFVACCDVAVGATSAVFGLTEVRFGVVPAPIQVQLDAAIGTREVRRYALTGERFGAEEAQRIGLLHDVVAPEELDEAVEAVVGALLAGAPGAIAACKALVLDLGELRMDRALVARMGELAVRARASEEAREGLTAFLEKRKPAWAVAPE